MYKNWNAAALQTHGQKHSSTATAANSRGSTTKQYPLFSPSSPASLDAAFVKIGHVLLSQWEMEETADGQYTRRRHTLFRFSISPRLPASLLREDYYNCVLYEILLEWAWHACNAVSWSAVIDVQSPSSPSGPIVKLYWQYVQRFVCIQRVFADAHHFQCHLKGVPCGKGGGRPPRRDSAWMIFQVIGDWVMITVKANNAEHKRTHTRGFRNRPTFFFNDAYFCSVSPFVSKGYWSYLYVRFLTVWRQTCAYVCLVVVVVVVVTAIQCLGGSTCFLSAMWRRIYFNDGDSLP